MSESDGLMKQLGLAPALLLLLLAAAVVAPAAAGTTPVALCVGVVVLLLLLLLLLDPPTPGPTGPLMPLATLVLLCTIEFTIVGEDVAAGDGLIVLLLLLLLLVAAADDMSMLGGFMASIC